MLIVEVINLLHMTEQSIVVVLWSCSSILAKKEREVERSEVSETSR